MFEFHLRHTQNLIAESLMKYLRSVELISEWSVHFRLQNVNISLYIGYMRGEAIITNIL